MKFTFFKEFKEFAIKGNMIDISIGVILGSAFNKLIDSIVKEAFMPPLALLTDDVKWSNKEWVLREAVINNGKTILERVAIGYGKLLETGVDFLIIALTVFTVVKLMNAIKNKSHDPEDKSETTPKDIELLNNINQLMEKQVIILEKMAKAK